MNGSRLTTENTESTEKSYFCHNLPARRAQAGGHNGHNGKPLFNHGEHGEHGEKPFLTTENMEKGLKGMFNRNGQNGGHRRGELCSPARLCATRGRVVADSSSPFSAPPALDSTPGASRLCRGDPRSPAGEHSSPLHRLAKGNGLERFFSVLSVFSVVKKRFPVVPVVPVVAKQAGEHSLPLHRLAKGNGFERFFSVFSMVKKRFPVVPARLRAARGQVVAKKPFSVLSVFSVVKKRFPVVPVVPVVAKNSFSPCSPCSPWLKNHAGFVLPSAIFLLVVLASLAAFLVSISQTQNVTLAQNVQGSRAYEAARAGVEWGLFRVFAETPPVCDSTASKAIEGFAVTIECTAYPNATDFYMENGNKLRVYRLISTASNGTPGAMGFVERQIQATIARPDL